MQEIKVAVLIETDDQWGRTIVQRILQLATDMNWRLLIAPRDSQHRLRLPRGWDGNGVIASLRDRSLVRHLKSCGVPVIDVSAMEPKADWFGRVATDDQSRASMAVEYLIRRGYQDFATYAPQMGRYGQIRGRQFSMEVEKAGFRCQHFETGPSSGWQINHRVVELWLKSLPPRTAVFAADPHPARQLAEVCLFSGIPIPDTVAILSGDDDDLLCNSAIPNISAVQLDCQQIAEMATEMLAGTLKRKRIPKREKLVLPIQIVSRHSTGSYVQNDPVVRQFLQIAEIGAQNMHSVTQVAKALSVSRRQLELKIKQHTGKTPAKLLQTARLSAARKQLVETADSITHIAFRCGFPNGSALTRQFSSAFGYPPSQLRKNVHRRSKELEQKD